MPETKDQNGMPTTPPHPIQWEQLPATYVNRFTLTVSPGLTRIIFGEEMPSGFSFARNSIILSTADAIGLAELILQVAEENKKLVAALENSNKSG